MAYFSLHAYDADVWLPQFRGLNQADVGLNPDVRFAAEEYNLETPHGVLQPQAAIEMMSGSFPSKVETLAVFHRRWYEGPGSHEEKALTTVSHSHMKILSQAKATSSIHTKATEIPFLRLKANPHG